MTQVIIDDIIPRTQLVATAGQTVFNTNWTADAATDILVYARADGVAPDDATQLVSSSLYNVTFVGGSETVRVTFLSGRTLGDVITIVRNTPADRQNLYINTNFVPSMLNEDFGILTLVDQQAQMYNTVVNPGYNVSATIETKDKILPILGPQQVWQMNEDGTAIEAVTIDTDNIPAPSNAYYWLSQSDTALDNGVNLGALTSGLLKHTVAIGHSTPATAVNGVDYWAPGDALTRSQAPTNGNDVTNKTYVDSVAIGFNIQPSCVCKSTTALTVTYNNGSSGVGATLTNAGAQAALTLDGVSVSVGQRVLITNQASTLQNGIYTVTNIGSVSSNWILTRATDFDTPSEIQPGDFVVVTSGTTYGQTSWIQTATVNTVGTDAITFIQFSASVPITVVNGGTGLTSLTAYALLAGGTTSTGNVQQVSVGTSGFLLQSGGAGALPSFTGTPNLGTPSAGVLTNCTGLPLGSITGLGTGVATFLATPSSANLLAALTTKTGTGLAVFGTSPTLTTPNIGVATATSITFSNTATGGIVGTTTNDDAAAGYVGEYSFVNAGNTALTTATAKTVTSLTLTAGDWHVWGNITYTPGTGSTTIAQIFSCISVTNNTTNNNISQQGLQLTYTTGGINFTTVNPIRMSISATTTFYLVAYCVFNISTMNASGQMAARRIR